MKNRLSLLAYIVVGLVLITTRVLYSGKGEKKHFSVTTWDAFGYYMYLPGTFIYNDVSELKWFDSIEEEYQLTGGELYQADKYDNGNYVFKYLGGISILQAPFFAIGHCIALVTDYPADGFSEPYQYSIAFGAVLYVFLALLLLRKILRRYFNESTVAITILLLALATNLIQYASVDSAQSHAYLFPLHVLVLYFTIKWHDAPKFKWAALIGLTIGLATISRPTEAVLIFIPIFWNTFPKENSRQKWLMVKANIKQFYVVLLFGLIGILPQLIYWKITSGSFIYNVGSKWDFANPHWRVLFGFERGWFIYTPITLLMVFGLYTIRKEPYRYAIIAFCLANIYIIIAWHDWMYGSTYSCRALVQSYPFFAIPLAAVIHKITQTKFKFFLYLIGVYLIIVNLIQINQYNRNIIHHSDMNANYYSAIYLNLNPTPKDYSLLDQNEILSNSEGYDSKVIYEIDTLTIKQPEIFEVITDFDKSENWLVLKLEIKVNEVFACTNICLEHINDKAKIRLSRPESIKQGWNDYEVHLKASNEKGAIIVFLETCGLVKGQIRNLTLEHFAK